jgi:plastocyanin
MESTQTETATESGKICRRGFVGLVGAGATGLALSETTEAQEFPVVTVGNNYFNPIGLHVEPGTTVRFEILSRGHSVTAYEDRIPRGATAFDSGTVSGGTFEHTFEESGTYDYHCVPHESGGMVGRIVVGEPGGPAEEGMVPHGDVPDSQVIVDEGHVGIASEKGRSNSMMGQRDDSRGMSSMRRGGGFGVYMLLMPVTMLTLFGLILGGLYRLISDSDRGSEEGG